MSTITREQLTRIIDSAGFIITALSGDDEVINTEYENNHSAAWDKLITEASPEVVRELARIALASQGSKKIILYRERNPYNGLTTGWEELTEQEYEIVKDHASKHAEFRTVYTAPPVPVSVPDFKKLARELVENLVDCDGADDSAVKQYLKWTEKTCRDTMLQGAEPVTTAYKLPANVIGALEKALQAMSFMGDTLNEMDAVCEEDVEYVTPAFEAVRKVLDGGSPVIPDGLCPCCGRKQLKSRTCSVAGCEGKHVAHGFCKKHYDIERKKDPSRRESIRAADERYRARKSAASQQEVK